MYLSHFLHFQGLNFIFLSLRDTFVSKLHIQDKKIIIYPKQNSSVCVYASLVITSKEIHISALKFLFLFLFFLKKLQVYS